VAGKTDAAQVETGLPGRWQVEPGRSNSRGWGRGHEVAGTALARQVLWSL